MDSSIAHKSKDTIITMEDKSTNQFSFADKKYITTYNDEDNDSEYSSGGDDVCDCMEGMKKHFQSFERKILTEVQFPNTVCPYVYSKFYLAVSKLIIRGKNTTTAQYQRRILIVYAFLRYIYRSKKAISSEFDTDFYNIFVHELSQFIQKYNRLYSSFGLEVSDIHQKCIPLWKSCNGNYPCNNPDHSKHNLKIQKE